jgi:hypothetical protein
MGGPSKCFVAKLACNRREDRTKVAVLQELAHGQRVDFHDIFPWEGQVCKDKHVVVYVALEAAALEPTPVITVDWLERNQPLLCGWLNVRVSTVSESEGVNSGQKIAFISDVTTRAAKDVTYRGVGSALIHALEVDATLNATVDFIYLFPLSNVVGFYRKLGYVQLSPHIPHMFKVLGPGASSNPTPAFIADLEQRYAQTKNETPVDMLDHFEDDVPRSTMRALRKIVKADPDVIYELVALLQEGDEEALDEWLDLHQRHQRHQQKST